MTLLKMQVLKYLMLKYSIRLFIFLNISVH